MSTGPPLLHTAPEVAGQIRMSTDWLLEQARRRKIPHRRLGRSVRFTDEDVAAIVASFAVPSAETTPAPRAARRTYPTYTRRSA